MALPTYGTMAVDWEQRVDFDRLRRERLARAKALLAKSEMGALLCFDMNNVRYITATHIGTWAQDKNQPLHAAAAERRADPVGFRLGRAASPAALPVARRAFARRHSAAARRDVAGNGPRGRCGEKDSRRTRNARPAQGAARRGHHRAADSVRAAEAKESPSSTGSR